MMNVNSGLPGIVSEPGRLQMGEMQKPKEQLLQEFQQKVGSGQGTWVELLALENMKNQYDAMQQSAMTQQQPGMPGQPPPTTVAQDIVGGLPTLPSGLAPNQNPGGIAPPMPQPPPGMRRGGEVGSDGVRRFRLAGPTSSMGGRHGRMDPVDTPVGHEREPAPVAREPVRESTTDEGELGAPPGGVRSGTQETGAAGTAEAAPGSSRGKTAAKIAGGTALAGLAGYGLFGGDDEEKIQPKAAVAPEVDVSKWLKQMPKADEGMGGAGGNGSGDSHKFYNPVADITKRLQLERPEEVTEEEALKQVKAQYEAEGYGKADAERRAQLDSESDKMIKDRKQELWLSVAAPAFFKMAAEGQTKNFWAAAGMGGQTATEHLAELNQRTREAERRIKDERYQLAKADEQLRLGQHKDARAIYERSQDRIHEADKMINQAVLAEYEIKARMALEQYSRDTQLRIAGMGQLDKRTQLWLINAMGEIDAQTHLSAPVREAMVNKLLDRVARATFSTSGSALGAQYRTDYATPNQLYRDTMQPGTKPQIGLPSQLPQGQGPIAPGTVIDMGG